MENNYIIIKADCVLMLTITFQYMTGIATRMLPLPEVYATTKSKYPLFYLI